MSFKMKDRKNILELPRLILTEKISEMILNKFHIKTIRQDNKEEIWIYKDGIYVENGRSYIEQFARDILEHKYKKTLMNDIVEKVKVATYIKSEDFFFHEDYNKYEIPVNNGILNVKTKKLSKFDPKKIYFAKLKWDYNPQSKCKETKKFLNSTLPEEDVKMVVQFLGFCLIRDYIVDKCFLFTGSGANGKSLILKLYRRFLGTKNCTNLTLHDMKDSSDNFSIINLHGKLCNISGDLSNNTIKTTGLFKRLTTGDLISANRKFKSSIEFCNTAKMVFNANELPYVQDDSDGFFRRWEIIEFPYKFVPKNEIKHWRTKNNKEKIKTADPDILKPVLNKDSEMEGLLNWVLELTEPLIKNKSFYKSTSSMENKKKWQRKSNSFLSFFEDNLCVDYNNYETKADIRREYIKYCQKHAVKILSDKSISITMSNKGIVTDRKQFDDGRDYIWSGVKFKETKKIETESDQEKKRIKKDLLNKIKEKELISTQNLLSFFSPKDHIYIENNILPDLRSTGEIYESKKGYWRSLL